MMLAELTLSDWACMSDAVARRECESLAETLPYGLELTGLKTRSYRGRTHRVARFSRREGGGFAQFVFVPGGEIRLGFDGQEFEPSPAQLASFAPSAKHFKFDPSIKNFVDSQTSDRRTAFIPPFLIEVEAQKVAPREDLEELGSDDPEFQNFQKAFPRHGRAEPWDGGELRWVVERSATAFRVWRRPPTTLQDVEARLAEHGMRLPSCDEWEHACGAGATTLFRWGNDNPRSFYPTDTCAEDRLLKRAWALSFARLRYVTPPASWDLHQQPNLFGLRIASDPYSMDLVADGPRALGGDGGCFICGTSSIFLGWLPLATAFRDYWGRKLDPNKHNVADEHHRVRRVIPIP